MSSQHFTPGSILSNKKHLHKLIHNNNNNNNSVNLKSNIEYEASNYVCRCFKDKVNLIKKGYNNPSQTSAERVSQLSINTLGGKTVFGNYNIPAKITYLGGIEGQPGGSPRPPRNQFN